MSRRSLREPLVLLATFVVLTTGSAQAGPNSGANATLIQPNGKIVAVGWGQTASWGAAGVVGLARYTPSGSLDRSFGSGGLTTTGYGTWPYGAAAGLQADGRIVVVGSARNGFELLRYKPNGSLDKTFGASGQVRTAFPSVIAQATAVAIQADGKIVAAGPLWVGSRGGTQAGFGLARYDADGSPDTSFGRDGRVTTRVDGGGNASALAIQPDGKIVAAGSYSGGFALTRYDGDGSPDASFGTGGIATTPVPGPDASAAALALQPDGKIVAAGSGHTLSYYKPSFVLVRYEADGSLDTSFGTGGIVSTTLLDDEDEANAVALQPDGKIVAAGQACRFGPCVFALARYNPDGTLDTGFGSGGKVTTSSGLPAGCMEQGGDYANAVAFQADGKIVAAGDSNFGCHAESYVFMLARYNPDGSLDKKFGKAGIVNTSVQACVVPRLYGESLAWAKGEAKRSNCILGKVSHVPSRTVQKGGIVSQQPGACALREPRAKVSVTVSKGSSRPIPRPAHPGAIAYDSVNHLGCVGGSGRSSLYAIEPNGSVRERLTFRRNAVEPVWSPDGRKIAFIGRSKNDIYVMNANGSRVRRVVAGYADHPTFSPDGKRLAYRRPNGIWTMRTDGKDKREIVGGEAASPDWSPDGEEIAFIEGSTIYTVSARGGSPKAVPCTGGADSVAWAPNGRQVVILMSTEAGPELAVVNVSDGSSHVVATNVDSDARPAWSPDGKRIAYVRFGATGQELVTVKAAGGGLRVVTRMIGGPRGVSWRR